MLSIWRKSFFAFYKQFYTKNRCPSEGLIMRENNSLSVFECVKSIHFQLDFPDSLSTTWWMVCFRLSLWTCRQSSRASITSLIKVTFVNPFMPSFALSLTTKPLSSTHTWMNVWSRLIQIHSGCAPEDALYGLTSQLKWLINPSRFRLWRTANLIRETWTCKSRLLLNRWSGSIRYYKLPLLK